MDLKETELCLGFPGGGGGFEGEIAKSSLKRGYSDTITELKLNLILKDLEKDLTHKVENLLNKEKILFLALMIQLGHHLPNDWDVGWGIGVEIDLDAPNPNLGKPLWEAPSTEDTVLRTALTSTVQAKSSAQSSPK
ncbi:hypothetical protein IFM89_002373 [Coptis chinensis]|uniref:Uncharacterized protein n=1 Tax=Coptis chinensis TaxID=261450 RepID=A0A835ILC7_9MAGN|nr:hypothetical protein IFM89_002373 [Coptis chinensis]